MSGYVLITIRDVRSGDVTRYVVAPAGLAQSRLPLGRDETIGGSESLSLALMRLLSRPVDVIPLDDSPWGGRLAGQGGGQTYDPEADPEHHVRGVQFRSRQKESDGPRPTPGDDLLREFFSKASDDDEPE